MDQVKKMGLGAWEEISDSVRNQTPLLPLQAALRSQPILPFSLCVIVCVGLVLSLYQAFCSYVSSVGVGVTRIISLSSTSPNSIGWGGGVRFRQIGEIFQAIDKAGNSETLTRQSSRLLHVSLQPRCRAGFFGRCIGRRGRTWLWKVLRIGRCPRSLVKTTVAAVSVSCVCRGRTRPENKQ